MTGCNFLQMSWYSKRAVLAGLYQSAELVFLQDTSPDYAQTQEFLNRRMKELGVVGSCLEQVRLHCMLFNKVS